VPCKAMVVTPRRERSTISPFLPLVQWWAPRPKRLLQTTRHYHTPPAAAAATMLAAPRVLLPTAGPRPNYWIPLFALDCHAKTVWGSM